MSTKSWKPWLFAALSALAVFAAEQTIELFQKQSLLEHEKLHVIDQLAKVRARIEGVINGNLLLTHGLTAVIAAQPDIDQAGFARIARNLLNSHQTLRNIGGAPGMVVSLMYPLEGNEAAIGLDYRTHPTQRDAAIRAVQTGDSVIAGPLPLVQGGTGIIAREPVFLPSETKGEPARFWGLVSAVIDVDKLYRQAGLRPAGGHSDLALAIRGKDGAGADGEPFFGDPAMFSQDSVKVMVSLPGGAWQIAATPHGGWGQHRGELLPIRMTGFAIALLLAAMAYLLTRDIVQRRHAEDRLRASAERLQAAEAIARIGNWEYRVAVAQIQWSDESYRTFGLQPQERSIDYQWLRSRVHPDDRARHDGCLQRMLDSRPGEDIPEFRCRMRRMDDQPRLLSVWVRIEYDDNGRAARLFGTVQDVTEAHQMHQDLQARLEELARWQGVMLGREDRIQELKREVNRLLLDQGQPARYASQAEES